MTPAPVAGRGSDRRLGWIMLGVGVLAVIAAQAGRPVGVPLYDGVVVQEPYRFLHPTADQAGSPTSFDATPNVESGLSPTIAAATTENPPQAQLIAQRGAFDLTAGATAVHVTITPVEAPPPPSGGMIAGNVYRFSVTDQAGAPLSVHTCDGCLSLSLRAPDGTGEAALQRYADGKWHDVDTNHAGILNAFQTNATEMGDYAVIEVTAEEPGLDPLVVGGLIIVGVLLVLGAFLLFRVRPGGSPPPPGPRTRIPSKRTAPRRSPQGRSRS
jgi:hypothetical protein